MMTRRGIPVLLIAALAIVSLSCGKKGVPYDDQPSTTTHIEIVSGNNQTAAAGSILSDSLLIRVLTTTGDPVEGISVTFSQITPEAGGHFTWSTTQVTNSQGYARNRYYLDTLIGIDTVRVVASGLNDSIAYFAMTVLPDAAKNLAKVSPLTTIGTVAGETMPEPYVVKITDKYGNPVSGHRVYFVAKERCLVTTDSSQAAGFEDDTAYTRTDASGEASGEWIFTANYPGYPFSSDLSAFDSLGDSVFFIGYGTDPGVFEYYYDIRPILADHCFSCHAGTVRSGGYALDYYYEVSGDGNMTPGDTTSPLLEYLTPNHWATHINIVEEDKIIRWVVTDNAAPGHSGLNNYTDNMKAIFDAHCISCHSGATPSGSYDMTTLDGIRGEGTDATPNAIPGDTACFLARVMKPNNPLESMRVFLGADSTALADSVIHWITIDSLRDH
ncbi:MAG: hypothetical protein GYA46_14540 [candidate division Zixibacteria bacterium]|nr:hypothetical protein [candidate division Zixibacteria bacterium]